MAGSRKPAARCRPLNRGANHCTDNSFEFGWPVVNKWHGPEEEVLRKDMKINDFKSSPEDLNLKLI